MLGKSNVTSISFTVEDDLISESSLNSTHKSAFKGLKPFAKKFGLNQQPIDERPLPNKANKDLIERAQLDAYRQMNQHLFNPFQHKLGNSFMPKQSSLYQQQKNRQIQYLKKKQQQEMSSNKNYTIVFHNEKKSKANLQMAGKNILEGGSQAPSIADYYKQKFAKKSMENIEQENDEIQNDADNENKKVNNFIGSSKKVEKKIQPVVQKKQNNLNLKEKTVSTSQKRNSQQSRKSNTTASSNNNAKDNRKNDAKNKIQVSDPLLQQIKPKIKAQETQKKTYETNKTQNSSKATQQKPPFNLNVSNKNIEITKRQDPKRQMPKKPPISQKITKNLQNQKKKFSQVYEGPDRNLVEQLQRQLAQCPNISFDDIAQLQVAKNLLQQAVLLPRLMPQFFQGIRKAMKGVLLFGPPGTGKTLLAKAVAKDNVFFNVSASSLASKWKGQSQKMVRILFQMAKHHSPSVIFFDEIDCIGSKRSQNEHQSARKVKTELLVQMDGVGSTSNQVFVLAATNRPWDLDEALRRRLEKRIYIPLPGSEGRKKMFDINLKGLKISSKVNWQKLIQLTKGCSGADICNVCRDAAYMPMRRKINEVGGIGKLGVIKQSELIDSQILETDLFEAAKKIKPSVGKEDLKKYENWMAQFGST